MENIISITNLELRFGQSTIIKNFNLDVIKGQIVTLFGPSGCGKSSILKTILGMYRPNTGAVRIKGINAVEYSLPLAYTPQMNELLPWKTVAQNIELWNTESLKFFDKKYGLSKERALGLVELEGAANKYPRQLSGGMERRTALARCIATHSDILLLDEGLISVERRLRRHIMNVLRRHIKEQGITAVCISHDYEETIFMSDRILLLSANPAQIQKDFIVDLPADRGPEIFNTGSFTHAAMEIIAGGSLG
ncbi:MAG: ABC transporter ATP-binding protein [Bacteroidota bacterium]